MDRIQAFAVLLFAAGLLTFPVFGLYLSWPDLYEAIIRIPLILRIGIFLFFSGFVILMLSLIRERIIDWKKEKNKK